MIVLIKFFRKQNFKILVFIILIVFLILPQNTAASSLHTLSDRMSRHAPLIGADHEIKFTTPSGIGEAGQYLRIIFDSGFDLSGLSYYQVDLFHGPITGLEYEEQLSPSTTSTTWGVSVSGSQIDLFHPLDSLIGDIALNDIIIIRIGFNATNGNGQINNPATIGSKIIAISGNYGDRGKLAVPVFQDQIGVGGETLNAAPNPVILSLQSVILETVSLNWTENSDWDFNRYEIYYSQNPGVTNLTGSLLASIGNKSQLEYSVSGLQIGQVYYFIVYVYDDDGNFTPSNQLTVAVSSGTGNPPPDLPQITCDKRRCAYFTEQALLSGFRTENSVVYVNNSTNNVEYPNNSSWNFLTDLNLGENFYIIYAMDDWDQISDYLEFIIERYKVGDTNGDLLVDDFDLSTLVAHFYENYCFSDFNTDDIVDDFDLSALAAHWSNTY
jgi:fibronectin type III domain protein